MKKVTAAIWLKDDTVLIAKRPEGDRLENRWEFPGGKIEAGESPQECLRREMAEEFCADIDVGEFFGSSVYTYDNGCIELLAYFVSGETDVLVMKAHDEYCWAPVRELGRFDFAPADLPLVGKLQEYLERP